MISEIQYKKGTVVVCPPLSSLKKDVASKEVANWISQNSIEIKDPSEDLVRATMGGAYELYFVFKKTNTVKNILTLLVRGFDLDTFHIDTYQGYQLLSQPKFGLIY